MKWVLFLLLFIYTFHEIDDRASEVVIELEFAADFDKANLEDLITLTFNSRTQAPVMFYQIENQSQEVIDRLYAEIHVRSESFGSLLVSKQRSELGVTIPAGESIRFSNLDIIGGTVPGTGTNSKFDFELTDQGRNILSAIRNGALIGDDRYIVEVKLYKGRVPDDGAGYLSSNSIDFETRLSAEEINIRTDNEANSRLSNIDLRSETPTFQWGGLSSQVYRLVVVGEREGIDVEQSLNSRFNREHSSDNIRDTSENVYLDILTRGNVFELPESLVNSLEQGRNYAWQVRSNIRTTHGSIPVESDIWRFSTNKVLDDELIDLLSSLFGRERVERMVNEGLQLHSIELDGEVYTAEEALVVLREMKQKIINNNAKVGG
jgi:hypothetical protein